MCLFFTGVEFFISPHKPQKLGVVHENNDKGQGEEPFKEYFRKVFLDFWSNHTTEDGSGSNAQSHQPVGLIAHEDIFGNAANGCG